MKRSLKRWIVVAGVLLLIAAAAGWRLGNDEAQQTPYRTARVERGDLVVSISATGTVEPQEVVDVGAQVAGQILSFGTDADGKTVDYGSPVEEGTVLARIDDSLYLADAAQADAQVQAAAASLKRAEADLEQLKAKLRQAKRDWVRAQKIGPSEALAQASYDAYQSAFETAEANVAVGEAAIRQARASQMEAEAMARRAQRNLGYCTITSPVKGVIIDRRVNIGQTVVASLNAPSLFLIAKDLTHMQVWVAVNEADIGKMHPGQPVTFTVDAFPGETFKGEVGKIRLNASMTQNVVTYTVEVLTDNSSGRLLPYLTANVQFELNRLEKVLLVPNAALRWTPPADQIPDEFRGAAKGPTPGKGEGKGETGPGPSSGSPGNPGNGTVPGVVWALKGQRLRPAHVQAGPSDGTMTRVEGKDLAEGLEVVTGLNAQAGGPEDASNPFTPQLIRGGRNAGSR
jgi:HlyD family secretion protein